MDIPTTDFTATIHTAGYPAIAPTHPALSQTGRTVLVTGGGTNIGKSIARHFGLAGAATVLLAGRRVNVLEAAVIELQAAATAAGSATHYRATPLDVTDDAQVDALWASLAANQTAVDVLVLNSAQFSPPESLLALGTQQVWRHFEANVKGPLHMAERFSQQGGDGKSLQYLSTNAVNLSGHSIVALRPAYSLTKMTGTYAFSLIADSVQADTMQVLSFHPGMVYTDAWTPLGITQDMLPFDNESLAGCFSVWAASAEARFLHGRYVYAAWDVEELRDETKALADHDYLRPGIIGLKGGLRA